MLSRAYHNQVDSTNAIPRTKEYLVEIVYVTRRQIVLPATSEAEALRLPGVSCLPQAAVELPKVNSQSVTVVPVAQKDGAA